MRQHGIIDKILINKNNINKQKHKLPGANTVTVSAFAVCDVLLTINMVKYDG